jgi:hypothetical protein
VGWDKGRYYSRSRKVNGRVVREYCGVGEVAELAAHLDTIKRAQREAEQEARRAEKAELDALDAGVKELDDLTDLLARAALLAAGYRQHKRGEWRKRRGNRKRAEDDCSDRPEGITQVAGEGAEGRRKHPPRSVRIVPDAPLA